MKIGRITYILTAIIFVFILISSLWGAFSGFIDDQHFSLLSASFWQGKAHFIEPQLASSSYWIRDLCYYNGVYYWSQGVFPALLLMPFTGVYLLLGLGTFPQAFVQLPLVILIFGLIYKIVQKYGFNKNSSLWLACAYLGASSLYKLAATPSSWYFSQIVCVALMLLIWFEHLNQNRPKFLGFLFAALLLTRPTAFLFIIYFIWDTLKSHKKEYKVRLKQLFIPIIYALIIFFMYNYLRFGSIFEQGYSYQINIDPILLGDQAKGIFGLQNVANNLYHMLFRGLLFYPHFPYISYDNWGLSIFILSPYLLYLFAKSKWDNQMKALLVNALIIATPILTFYATGFSQLGYRYSMDFFLLIFIILLKKLQPAKEIPKLMKVMIIISVILTIFLSLNHYQPL